MQYKNIIFDLGNVLVKLNPEGCIGAFKAIGMGELANPNPQSEGMKLMSKLGVGMITTEAFCDAARELTGADLVRLYFNKESAYNSWDYCFNQQCPLAQECAHYLSVTYKKPEQTKGYAIYPDAYHDNKCEHFLQLQMMKMAYGFMNILEELKRKDEASFRVHMTSYFGSKTSYYRYKLGQTGLVPEQQQYVLKWCQQHGYTDMRFDRYAEEVNY